MEQPGDSCEIMCRREMFREKDDFEPAATSSEATLVEKVRQLSSFIELRSSQSKGTEECVCSEMVTEVNFETAAMSKG